ncbi:DUF1643 domain-containing protein [Priestia flexa]|uniref:DUF1643 domain-containing protein n=1 Tax=Priestia flexa TaxID=86664 RepID=UPI003D2E595B
MLWFEKLAKDNQLTLLTGTYANISGKTVFNKNGKRRYFLEKRWARGGNVLTAIMMNPSSAAHNQTDKTVDQLIDVAKVQGCHALYVVNISSIIDGSSDKLKSVQFSYEAINWAFVPQAMTEAKVVFLGWGIKGQLGMLEQQKSNPDLVNTFTNLSSKLYCYDVLKSKDKKFATKPLYYLPHPRPRLEQEKYRYEPIRKITSLELVKLLIR